MKDKKTRNNLEKGETHGNCENDQVPNLIN
jgi:hypothetical protein